MNEYGSASCCRLDADVRQSEWTKHLVRNVSEESWFAEDPCFRICIPDKAARALGEFQLPRGNSSDHQERYAHPNVTQSGSCKTSFCKTFANLKN
jgi:hypothetical protein